MFCFQPDSLMTFQWRAWTTLPPPSYRLHLISMNLINVRYKTILLLCKNVPFDPCFCYKCQTMRSIGQTKIAQMKRNGLNSTYYFFNSEVWYRWHLDYIKQDCILQCYCMVQISEITYTYAFKLYMFGISCYFCKDKQNTSW